MPLLPFYSNFKGNIMAHNTTTDPLAAFYPEHAVIKQILGKHTEINVVDGKHTMIDHCPGVPKFIPDLVYAIISASVTRTLPVDEYYRFSHIDSELGKRTFIFFIKNHVVLRYVTVWHEPQSGNRVFIFLTFLGDYHDKPKHSTNKCC
jgi:hypothetical protein